MTDAATARPARRDHRFFLVAGLAAFTIVFIGFARTYYLKGLFGTPALPALLHLHGFLMTSWFVLFFVQARLVAAQRVDLHRRLGVLGGILAAFMVLVGFTVARRAAARDLQNSAAGGGEPLQFMGFILFVLLVFAILVSAALLLRRRKDYHKRLMLLSCLSMVGPGLFRIPLEHVPVVSFLKTGGPLGLFGLDLLLVYACIGYDTWRHRRLHPAFVCGALLIVIEDLPFVGMFLSSATWTHLATWLVS
jgi:hypothetical protein